MISAGSRAGGAILLACLVAFNFETLAPKIEETSDLYFRSQAALSGSANNDLVPKRFPLFTIGQDARRSSGTLIYF